MLSHHEVTLFLAANHSSRNNRAADREVTEAIRNRRLRVLIIDDTARFRISMARMLTRVFKATVSAVESGNDGIDLVKSGKIFDVIFLDLKMPGIGGLATHDVLRQSDVACRIVVMSAHRGSEEWQAAEESNVELVDKPIPDETLVSILSEL